MTLIKVPKINPSEIEISAGDFLKSYNANIPATFPQATSESLQRFKDLHASLFKHGDMWSLDIHRKKLIDWLPHHLEAIIREASAAAR